MQAFEQDGHPAAQGSASEEEQDDSERGLQSSVSNEKLREVVRGVGRLDPHQPEFLQAVAAAAASLEPVFQRRPELLPVFRRLCEPERQVMFRVAWLDDANRIQVNRGFRVQFNSAIGPYKGGLRFHPSVNLSVIKMLGFEQVLKNSLTTLPLGGAKGGADFDPKVARKSDGEIMRFCQSFMTELARFIGQAIDVPAGDIGVGQKELGYLYGQFKRLTMESTPVLTGRGMEWGGSEIRPESTGWGVAFFAEEVLKDRGDSLQGKRCLVSGAGNVAQHCAAKLIELGATVLAMSDSRGCIYKPGGLTAGDVEQVMRVKSSHSGSLEEVKGEGIEYRGNRATPWGLGVAFDMAFPCATQNELGGDDARSLVENGCKFVLEGANMPCTDEAVRVFKKDRSGVAFVPGKAANAGGVAVSAQEIFQDRAGVRYSREEMEERLRGIMQGIYRACKAAAEEYGVSLAAGASIAGFLKVADAMLAQGAV